MPAGYSLLFPEWRQVLEGERRKLLNYSGKSCKVENEGFITNLLVFFTPFSYSANVLHQQVKIPQLCPHYKSAFRWKCPCHENITVLGLPLMSGQRAGLACGSWESGANAVAIPAVKSNKLFHPLLPPSLTWILSDSIKSKQVTQYVPSLWASDLGTTFTFWSPPKKHLSKFRINEYHAAKSEPCGLH